MKVLVLDIGQKKSDSVRDAFSKKNLDAVVCTTSNEFMTAVTGSEFEKVYINMEAWKRGRCVYDYFLAWQRFEDKPVVFYNADENLPTAVGMRKSIDKDRVFYKPSDIEAVISAA